MKFFLRDLFLVTAIVGLVVGAIPLFAKEPKTSASIAPGQQIEDALAILREYKLRPRKQGFDEAASRDDSDDVVFDLDDDTLGRVYYSKATKQVTGVSLLLGKDQPKSFQKWVSAKSLWLVDDGSYILHLKPTVTQKTRRKDEVPSSKGR